MKLVKFEKANCTPCKMMDAFLKEKEITPDVKVVPDNHPTLAMKYGVMSVPVLVWVEDDESAELGLGKEIERVAGVGQGKITRFLEATGLL
ncbi:MAG: thioredoxin family protein [Gammaproteobacteria bacterium]